VVENRRLTTKEAAAILDVCPGTLRSMDGSLRPSRTPRGHRRYSREMLENHLEKNGLSIAGRTQTGGNILFGAKEASEYLGVSHVTLGKIENLGLLQPYRTPGGHRRYSLQMLDEYLENSRRLSARR